LSWAEAERVGLIQIRIDAAVQQCWDGTLVPPARLGSVGGQSNPPTPTVVLERVPDLQGRKILRSAWAECEQRDHEAIAHTSGTHKVVPRKSLRLRYQRKAGLTSRPAKTRRSNFDLGSITSASAARQIGDLTIASAFRAAVA